MINEGQDTSANKTHLFNWLYNMAVQMAQGVGVCTLSVCAISTFALCPFVHVRVGGWLMHVPVISFLTSAQTRARDEEERSLIRKRALLLVRGLTPHPIIIYSICS